MATKKTNASSMTISEKAKMVKGILQNAERTAYNNAVVSLPKALFPEAETEGEEAVRRRQLEVGVQTNVPGFFSEVSDLVQKPYTTTNASKPSFKTRSMLDNFDPTKGYDVLTKEWDPLPANTKATPEQLEEAKKKIAAGEKVDTWRLNPTPRNNPTLDPEIANIGVSRVQQYIEAAKKALDEYEKSRPASYAQASQSGIYSDEELKALAGKDSKANILAQETWDRENRNSGENDTWDNVLSNMGAVSDDYLKYIRETVIPQNISAIEQNNAAIDRRIANATAAYLYAGEAAGDRNRLMTETVTDIYQGKGTTAGNAAALRSVFGEDMTDAEVNAMVNDIKADPEAFLEKNLTDTQQYYDQWTKDERTPAYEQLSEDIAKEQRSREAYATLMSEAQSSPTYEQDKVFTPVDSGRATGTSADMSTLYMWLNDSDFRTKYDNANSMSMTQALDNPFWAKGYEYMTEEEVYGFNAAYAQSEEAAERYLSSLNATGVLNRRRAEAQVYSATNFTESSPLVAKGLTFGTNVITAVQSPYQLVAAATGYETDPNSSMYDINRFNTTVRGTINQMANEISPALGFVDDVLTSLGDNLIAVGISKGFVGAAGLSGEAANKWVTGMTQSIMSSNAASNSLYESLQAGDDQVTAVAKAIASGGIEALTEKYSIETLLSDPTSAWKHLAKNFLAEGSEEVASDLLNPIADAFISGITNNRSEIEREYNNYILQGYSKKEASDMVMNGFVKDLVYDFFAGGFAGGLGAGTFIAANAYQGSQLKNAGTVNGLKEIAATMPEDSKTRKYLNAVERTGSNYSTAQLYNTLHEELPSASQETLDKIVDVSMSQQLKDMGEEGDTGVIAGAIRKVVSNQKLTEEERSAITSSKAGLELMNKATSVSSRDSAEKRAYDKAYNAGFYGREIAEGMNQEYYQHGVQDAQAAEQRRLDLVGKGKAGTGSVRYIGTVLSDADIGTRNSMSINSNTLANMDTQQQEAVGAIQAIAKVVPSINFVLYEGQANDSGVIEVENGKYETTTNTLYIDLNSGKTRVGQSAVQYTIMQTVAHEMTHFIESNSTKGYATYRQLIKDTLAARGQNFDALVQHKLDVAEDNGISLTRDGAVAEVVADASEMMLKDTKAFQQLAEKDKSLAKNIGNFVKGLLSKIRKALGGVSAKQPEARALMEAEQYVAGLQEAWDAALVEAVETVENGRGNETETSNASENVKFSQQENEALDSVNVQLASNGDSAYPVSFSLRTWNESDYQQNTTEAAKALSAALDVSERKARKWINDVNGIAKYVADNRELLDYEANEFASAIKTNSEYGHTLDFSTICSKRLLTTGTFDAIQRALPDTVLTQEDIFRIRKMMEDRGLEVACGMCYVESTRKKMGVYANDFLNQYKATNPDWIPTMADLNTVDGVDTMRQEHPEAYDAYMKFMKRLAQRKPKLLEKRTEYRGEILKNFSSPQIVSRKNLEGGFRIQSYSDFETVHMLDMMQAVMDMSRVGLTAQGYAKVPALAWIFGDTGVKINLSMVANGVKDGKLVYDEVAGMKQSEVQALRERYSKNVGSIVVTFTDAQLKAAMADDFVDFIIPFHRSQWAKRDYASLGLSPETRDYTMQQSERWLKPHYNANGKKQTRPSENFRPNSYWDFSKSGKQNAETYLRMCAEDGRRPKFSKYLVNNGDGSFSLQPDGSTDGYWKLLIDFKMYDNDGVGSPQLPVHPNFNMEEANRLIREYKGGHSTFPVAQDVVDEFVAEKKSQTQAKFALRDQADTPEFQRWFKDSEVVDSDGNPKIVYHATDATFTVFDRDKLGSNTRTNTDSEAAARSAEVGFWFSDRDPSKDMGTNNSMPVYLSIKNGYHTSLDNMLDALEDMTAEEYTAEMQDNGYDGLIVQDSEFGGTSYVVFDPEQIKSATDNVGTFDPSNPDIRYSFREETEDDLTDDYLMNMSSADVETDADRLFLNRYQYKRASYAKSVEALNTAVDKLNSGDLQGDALIRQQNRVKILQERVNRAKDELRMLEDNAGTRKLRDSVAGFVRENLVGRTDEEIAQLVADAEAEVDRLIKMTDSTDKDVIEAQKRLKKLKSTATQKVIDAKVIRELSRKSAAAERRITTTIKKLNNMLLHETDYKNVPEELKGFVADVVKTFGIDFNGMVFSKKQAESLVSIYDHLQKNDSSFMQSMYNEDIAEMMSDLVEYADMYQNIRLGTVTDENGNALDRLERAKLRNFIMESASDIVNFTDTMVKNSTEMRVNGRKQKFATIANNAMAEMNERPDRLRYQNKLGDASDWMEQLIVTGNMTPVYFFDKLGNHEFKRLFDDFLTGQERWAFVSKASQQRIQEIMQEYKYDTWKDADALTFTTQQGNEITLDKEQAMWLYATWKREHSNPLAATEHLTKGGFVYEGNKGTAVKKTMLGTKAAEKTTGNLISEEDMKVVNQYLDEQQKGYADSMVNFISKDIGALGNEVSMELFGIRKYKENYYFPYAVSRDHLYQKSSAGGGATTDDSRIKHSSFTHALTKGAQTPLVLGNFTDVVANHIGQMATYYGMTLPIENMNRVLNYKYKADNGSSVTMRSLIRQKYGSNTLVYMERLLRDANGGIRASDKSPMQKFVSLFKKSAVVASASVSLQQTSAMLRAGAMMNFKYLLQTPANYKAEYNELMKHSGVAIVKQMGQFDTNVGQSYTDWLLAPDDANLKLWGKVRQAFGAEGKEALKNRWESVVTGLPNTMDKVAWGMLWKAVKTEQADLHPDMDVKSEAFLDMCGERFNDIANHTQVYDSVLSRSQLMRSTNAINQMATAFRAEPTLTLNVLYDAFFNKNIPKEQRASRRASAVFAVLTSSMAAAIGSAMISAWGDDDDKRTAAEKFIRKTNENFFNNIMPLYNIPYISDIVSIFEGYDVERADMSLFADLVNSFNKINSWRKGNTTLYRAMEEFIGTLANFAGIPVKNLMRDARRVYNMATSRWEKPTKTGMTAALMPDASIPGWEYDTSAKAYCNRLVSAYMKGDNVKAKDIETYMQTVLDKDAEYIRDNVKKAVADRFEAGSMTEEEGTNLLYKLYKDEKGFDKDSLYFYFDKLKDKMSGKLGKDDTYSKYNDFYTAVETGKGLRPAISELESHGSSKDDIAGAITRKYSPIYVSLYKTNKREASNLLSRLLTAYEELGYDRDKKLKDIQRWIENDEKKNGTK